MLASTNEQARNLERVSGRIADLIVSFCRDRLDAKRPRFHMMELSTWVSRHSLIAPDSAGRILRDLRTKGIVSYTLISRHGSEYELQAVRS